MHAARTYFAQTAALCYKGGEKSSEWSAEQPRTDTGTTAHKGDGGIGAGGMKPTWKTGKNIFFRYHFSQGFIRVLAVRTFLLFQHAITPTSAFGNAYTTIGAADAQKRQSILVPVALRE